MTPAELARVRRRLVAFAEAMFEPLARADQRRWGEVYLRGLMLDGKRKSIQPMAERLPDGNEQALQQFLSQSPWDWRPVPLRSCARGRRRRPACRRVDGLTAALEQERRRRTAPAREV
jgi:SRSO17 transposase